MPQARPGISMAGRLPGARPRQEVLLAGRDPCPCTQTVRAPYCYGRPPKSSPPERLRASCRLRRKPDRTAGPMALWFRKRQPAKPRARPAPSPAGPSRPLASSGWHWFASAAPTGSQRPGNVPRNRPPAISPSILGSAMGVGCGPPHPQANDTKVSSGRTLMGTRPTTASDTDGGPAGADAPLCTSR